MFWSEGEARDSGKVMMRGGGVVLQVHVGGIGEDGGGF